MDARAALGAWPQHLGPLAAAMALLAALAGAPLALGYAASPAEAHASVAGMSPFLRGVHAWAASLAVVALLLDLACHWLAGALGARPWLGRALGLLALLALMQTGAVLAWDQQGWESLRHIRASAGQPGGSPADAPLPLLFAAHLGLPVLLLAAAWLAEPSARRWAEGLRGARPVVAIAAIAALALAALAPPGLGPEPIEGIAVSKPDWPFLWLVPLQDLLGPPALPLGAAIAGALLLAAARFGARWSDARRRRALLVAAAAFLALSAWGAFA